MLRIITMHLKILIEYIGFCILGFNLKQNHYAAYIKNTVVL